MTDRARWRGLRLFARPDDPSPGQRGRTMKAMTVSELRGALAGLREQDAPVLVWTSRAGEVVPHVIDVGETRILATSWDDVREVYVIHTTNTEE